MRLVEFRPTRRCSWGSATTSAQGALPDIVGDAGARRWQLGAELLVLHVVPPRTTRPWEEHTAGEHLDALAEAWVRDTRATLARAIEAISGAKPEIRGTVRLGLETDEILKVADDHQIDLIVMGRHGHGRTGRWLHGGVTDRVLRRASCPVVTIPARRAGHPQVGKPTSCERHSKSCRRTRVRPLLAFLRSL